MLFEVKIIEFLQSFSCAFLDGTSKVVSYFFDYPLVLTIAVLLLCFKKWYYLFVFLIVEGFCFFAQITLKYIINRPRPFVSHQSIKNIFEASNSSFPSGHSVTCMCAVVVLGYIISKSKMRKTNKVLCYIGLGFSLLACAFNRMYLGQHYLTDVLGGYILAFVLSAAIIYLIEKSCKKLKRV